MECFIHWHLSFMGTHFYGHKIAFLFSLIVSQTPRKTELVTFSNIHGVTWGYLFHFIYISHSRCECQIIYLIFFSFYFWCWYERLLFNARIAIARMRNLMKKRKWKPEDRQTLMRRRTQWICNCVATLYALHPQIRIFFSFSLQRMVKRNSTSFPIDLINKVWHTTANKRTFYNVPFHHFSLWRRRNKLFRLFDGSEYVVKYLKWVKFTIPSMLLCFTSFIVWHCLFQSTFLFSHHFNANECDANAHFPRMNDCTSCVCSVLGKLNHLLY